MKQHLKIALLCKVFALALPFFFLLGSFVVVDPFMIIKDYKDYDHPRANFGLQNLGYISWLKFKKNNPSKHYDSFILGASCTLTYQSKYWKEYINGSVFRLPSNDENLYEIVNLLEALEKQPHQKIRNILIVSEPRLLAIDEETKGIMHTFPREVSGRSIFSLGTDYVKGFFSMPFNYSYMKYVVSRMIGRKSGDSPENNQGIADPKTNDDLSISQREADINSKGLLAYYNEKKEVFAGVDTMRRETMPALFGDSQIALFKRVKAVAQRHNTNLKIAIGPNLETGYMNPKDDAILREIFGDKNVVNYNVPAHKDLEKKENFYDKVHYRPHIAKQILRDLYAN